MGYIGFSESMRLLTERKDKTRMKSVSFSDQENISRLYVDVAAVTAGVEGERYEKCLELMNVMAEAEVLTALSVQEGDPQYLMLARKTPYADLAGQFPLYGQMKNWPVRKGIIRFLRLEPSPLTHFIPVKHEIFVRSV